MANKIFPVILLIIISTILFLPIITYVAAYAQAVTEEKADVPLLVNDDEKLVVPSALSALPVMTFFLSFFTGIFINSFIKSSKSPGSPSWNHCTWKLTLLLMIVLWITEMVVGWKFYNSDKIDLFESKSIKRCVLTGNVTIIFMPLIVVSTPCWYYQIVGAIFNN